MKSTSRPTDPHAVEARLAARLAAGLSARAEAVPHDIAERLRFARERALVRARDLRLAAPAAGTIVGVSASGAASLSGFAPWWQRAASVLPVLVLVLGLVAIDRWASHEQVLAAADIDAQLLSGDLPPAAYSDPGFAEYLRSTPVP
jgi:anti-sigma factor RsiW